MTVNIFIGTAIASFFIFCCLGFKMFALLDNGSKIARKQKERQAARQFNVGKLVDGSYNPASPKQHNNGVPPEDPRLEHDKTYRELRNIQTAVRAERHRMGDLDDGYFFNY